MRPGGGKAKGAAFERTICKQLSRWVSDGQREDVFWRSAMSGGRATLGHRAGKNLSRQAGDICSVSPEGHCLTDEYYLECKHLKDIGLDAMVSGRGTLYKVWMQTKQEATKHGDRLPMLIVQQNRLPVLVGSSEHGLRRLFEGRLAAVLAAPYVDLYMGRFDDLLGYRCPFRERTQRRRLGARDLD